MPFPGSHPASIAPLNAQSQVRPRKYSPQTNSLVHLSFNSCLHPTHSTAHYDIHTMNSGMTPRLLHHTLLPLLAFLKMLELAQILLGNRFCRQISAVNFLFDLYEVAPKDVTPFERALSKLGYSSTTGKSGAAYVSSPEDMQCCRADERHADHCGQCSLCPTLDDGRTH